MTRKDFIKKIRDYNKWVRTPDRRKVNGIFINGFFFFYDSVKLDFDDEMHELFIYDRSRKKIMASINYQAVIICLNDWDI